MYTSQCSPDSFRWSDRHKATHRCIFRDWSFGGSHSVGDPLLEWALEWRDRGYKEGWRGKKMEGEGKEKEGGKKGGEKEKEGGKKGGREGGRLSTSIHVHVLAHDCSLH